MVLSDALAWREYIQNTNHSTVQFSQTFYNLFCVFSFHGAEHTVIHDDECVCSYAGEKNNINNFFKYFVADCCLISQYDIFLSH